MYSEALSVPDHGASSCMRGSNAGFVKSDFWRPAESADCSTVLKDQKSGSAASVTQENVR